MRDVITVGAPFLMILLGIFLNQRGLREVKAEFIGVSDSLRSEMNARFSHTDSKLDRIQADLQTFSLLESKAK